MTRCIPPDVVHKTPHFLHALYLHVSCHSEDKLVILFLIINKELVLLLEKECVLSAVRTKALDIIYIKFLLWIQVKLNVTVLNAVI